MALLFLFPLAWPFLVLYAMFRHPGVAAFLAGVGVTWYLFAHTTGWGWVALVLLAAILITALRIKEQDDHAREAVALQRSVELDLDRRDQRLGAERADRARMEREAELIAQALIREARGVRR